MSARRGQTRGPGASATLGSVKCCRSGCVRIARIASPLAWTGIVGGTVAAQPLARALIGDAEVPGPRDPPDRNADGRAPGQRRLAVFVSNRGLTNEETALRCRSAEPAQRHCAGGLSSPISSCAPAARQASSHVPTRMRALQHRTSRPPVRSGGGEPGAETDLHSLLMGGDPRPPAPRASPTSDGSIASLVDWLRGGLRGSRLRGGTHGSLPRIGRCGRPTLPPPDGAWFRGTESGVQTLRRPLRRRDLGVRCL